MFSFLKSKKDQNISPLDCGDNKEIINLLIKHVLDKSFSTSTNLFEFMKKDENKSDIVFSSLEFLIFQSHLFRTRLIESSKKNRDKNVEIFVNPIFNFFFSNLKQQYIFKSLFSELKIDATELDQLVTDLFSLKINKYSQIPLAIADNDYSLSNHERSAFTWTLFDALRMSDIKNTNDFSLLTLTNIHLKQMINSIETYDEIIGVLRRKFNSE